MVSGNKVFPDSLAGSDSYHPDFVSKSFVHRSPVAQGNPGIVVHVPRSCRKARRGRDDLRVPEDKRADTGAADRKKGGGTSNTSGGWPYHDPTGGAICSVLIPVNSLVRRRSSMASKSRSRSTRSPDRNPTISGMASFFSFRVCENSSFSFNSGGWISDVLAARLLPLLLPPRQTASRNWRLREELAVAEIVTNST